MNNDGSIHFSVATPLDKKYETTYLGNEVNKEVNIHHELSNKMQEVRKAWFKLRPLLEGNKCQPAVATHHMRCDCTYSSKSQYGLETLQLTEAMSKKLDTFQLKGLRQILGLETTFINRVNSNKQVFEVASSIAYPDPNDTRCVKRFSDFHKERKAKLLGHILRAENTDPLREVTFQPDSASRVE